MRTLLYINDAICSSIEQLRNLFSKELVSNTTVYEDLLTLQRDGELAQWLSNGITEEEKNLSVALSELSPDLPNNDLMRAMTEIILGTKVDVSKPNFSSFFEITNIRCEIDKGMVVFSESGNFQEEIQGIIHSVVQTKTSTYCRDVKLRPYIPELNVFESRFFVEVKIKKVDNESFTIRLLEKDGYELGCKNISLFDKKVGQIVSIEIKADIDISYDFSLKIDDYLFCDILIKKDVSPSFSCNVGNIFFNMIFIEGGSFMMGSNGYNEKKHLVTLDSFFICETAVTQELWEAVMHTNPSIFKGSKNPVENIYWSDCQVFIEKLSLITNMKFRLPTEAEWEYAARGGMASKNFLFSGSNTFDEIASRDNKTYPVATKKPNELGLYDMSGDVREWCQDWYDDKYYEVSPPKNPTGPLNSEMHVNRGGGWADGEECCRVSYRGALSTKGKCHYIGFRIAL